MEAYPPAQRKIVRIVLPLIFFILIFATGVVIGRAWEVRKEVTGSGGAVDIVKVLDLYGSSRSDTVEFEQFWTLWNRVKDKYVDQPVDDVDLFYGAIGGIVQGLDDPYSIYFPPQKATEFAKDLAGEFEGIGAEIGVQEGQLVIIAPLPSSPAEKAGLKPGDKIFSIDGMETHDMSLTEAVGHIRGERGTIVTLLVTQNGFETIREISVIREAINIPTVSWEMKEDNIAYIRISYFNQETWDEFDKAVREILLKSASGVILDLRSNPGGFLETSIAVASEWVPVGPIVRERGSDKVEKVHQTIGAHRFAEMPTVVLVDGGTASGSEIVAGALKDYNVATLVGEKTFGKGSVQDFEVFPDGSALKLTIAKWFTPKEKEIDNKGIEPNITIEEMFVENAEEGSDEDFLDKGVEKALELLKQ